MRTVIIFVLLFAYNMQGLSQELEKSSGRKFIYKKNHYYEGSEYIISFTIQKGAMKFVPSENNHLGQTHFEADIHVLKRNLSGNFKPVGVRFSGYYTENGCWEDDPEYLIKRAIRLEAFVKKIE